MRQKCSDCPGGQPSRWRGWRELTTPRLKLRRAAARVTDGGAAQERDVDPDLDERSGWAGLLSASGLGVEVGARRSGERASGALRILPSFLRTA